MQRAATSAIALLALASLAAPVSAADPLGASDLGGRAVSDPSEEGDLGLGADRDARDDARIDPDDLDDGERRPQLTDETDDPYTADGRDGLDLGRDDSDGFGG